MATISLGRCLRSDGGRFNHAKRLMIIGTAFGVLVWFFGFMVVGGEWFSMWQSPKWNGQEAAFRFYLTILAVLIFVNQPDGELSGTGSPRRHRAPFSRADFAADDDARAVRRGLDGAARRDRLHVARKVAFFLAGMVTSTISDAGCFRV